LCTDHGSALRYQASENGVPSAILDDNAEELDYIREHLLPLRDDVIAAFRAFCRVRNRYYLRERELAAFAAQALADLVFRPWRANARMLASARHRENFGTYTISRYSTAESATLRERLRFYGALLRDPRGTLLTSFWPALALFKNMNRVAAQLYGLARRAQVYRAARTAENRLGGGG